MTSFGWDSKGRLFHAVCPAWIAGPPSSDRWEAQILPPLIDLSFDPLIALFYQFNVQGDGHFLTNQDPAGFEDHIPVQPKILAVDLGRG